MVRFFQKYGSCINETSSPIACELRKSRPGWAAGDGVAQLSRGYAGEPRDANGSFSSFFNELVAVHRGPNAVGIWRLAQVGTT